MAYHHGSCTSTDNGFAPLICPSGPGGAQRQAVELRREGVTVSTGALRELSVDLHSYGWFPSRLPSEEDDDDSEAGAGAGTDAGGATGVTA